MHQRRSLTALAAVSGALALAAPAGAATSHLSAAARLAQRVAAATDARQIAELHQHLPGGYTDITYSDAPRQLELEYTSGKLLSGDLAGKWFSNTGRCYSTSKQPFVGLTSIGLSLLPQDAAGPHTTVAVAYRQLSTRELQWTLPASKQHGREQGTVWFNSQNLIIKSHTNSYSTGKDSSAQATNVTMSYPRQLPAHLPTSLPAPICKP